MARRPNRLPVVFYASSAGAEPVREWLQDLDRDDRREIGSDILAVQQGWPLGLPLCRPLGHGLWEVRSSLPRGRIARVIFAFDARKTPPAEIDLALKRLKEMTS